MTPETKFTRSGDVNIAYQTVGDGPRDLVLVPGWVSNVEITWEEPRLARFLRQLASFARVILFDKRGTGMSDRVTDMPALEERMDDVRAVMDAVGSERATLMGYSEGGPMCALFAATYPERTAALIMIGSYARRMRAPDYPYGLTEAESDAFVAMVEESWGTPVGLEVRAPSVVEDERFKEWWARFLRMSASPSAAAALTRANIRIDIRDILPSIRAPALIIHATGDQTCDIGHGRFLAARIPGASFVEIESNDHLPWLVGAEEVLQNVEEFVTGARHAPLDDSILCTIMFTDIVDSTRIAAEAGDRQWRDLLDAHHAAVRRELEAFRGQEVNTTGDGFVATFDGPARAIRCSAAACSAVRRIGLDIRIGLHTGECMLQGSELSGLAVHIAARVSTLAGAGEVLVSRTVKDLVVGSGLGFEDFGVHALKGVPDDWQLYRLAG